MSKENIIKILKNQHLEIEKILQEIDNYLENNKEIDSDYIYKRLLEFETLLIKHTTLEDSQFYPNLLKKMKKVNENTEDIEGFIGRMNSILNYVYIFLKEYDTPKKIKLENPESFRSLFIRMMSRLEIRINMEELFAYNK